ncbi:hypothetical protein SAMN05660841_03751 [Sphingobacterium nematocida]|uniref:Uncharacterized protein n=1 Tax=Sphingobacterium nematocida TaxID=1513896 RepID=A0A1T5G4H5_9SPHI|nr:hypothetical protein [Sphingobacterium nematocida]SKC03232.1 hypothetical protein SAMN05660841_03751 [Sphingobacterium nematocida]
MKKVVLALAVVFAAVVGTQAQTASSSSVKVKVNVELNPFQSIEIGTGSNSGDEVNLVYNTASDYKTGVSKLVEKQLKVSSVGSGYKVKATLGFNSGNSGKFNKVQGGGVGNIDAAQLLEIAIGKGGTVSGLTAGTTAAANMEFGPFGATSTGESSVLDQELDVKYFGKKLDEGMLNTLFGNQKSQAKYTIDVVYTITTN